MSQLPLPLTPSTFDRAVARPEKLWGAPCIAAALGVSVDKIYALAKHPDCPIFKPPGSGYFAFRNDLEEWLRTKPPPE